MKKTKEMYEATDKRNCEGDWKPDDIDDWYGSDYELNRYDEDEDGED